MEKTFNNIQHLLLKKKTTLNKLRMEGNFLKLTKSIYEKATLNIRFNVKG